MIKQVIILRKDLNMRKGKMVAQGSHASLACITQYFKKSVRGSYRFFPPKEMEEWLFNTSFTKICVSVDSEMELIKIYTIAVASGLTASLIQDKGHTEFHGQPTYTAVGIGPGEAEKIDKITGHLKLL